ncbi:unnamed protein product [Absidia cylindrospora]
MGTKPIHNDDESTTPLLVDNPQVDQLLDTDHRTSTHNSIVPNTPPLGITSDHNTQHGTSGSPTSHSLPSDDMNTKATLPVTTTTTTTSDDQKYCRICGEGEDEEDEDGMDSYYSNNIHSYMRILNRRSYDAQHYDDYPARTSWKRIYPNDDQIPKQ